MSQPDRQTDGQTNIQTNRQTDRQRDRETDRQTDRQTNRQTNRQADKQINKQTEKRTDKQTDKQTDRRTGYLQNRLVQTCTSLRLMNCNSPWCHPWLQSVLTIAMNAACLIQKKVGTYVTGSHGQLIFSLVRKINEGYKFSLVDYLYDIARSSTVFKSRQCQNISLMNLMNHF